MDAIGLQSEELYRDRHDGRIDFDNIDPSVVMRKIHGHNADAKPDTEHILNIRRVSASKPCQRVGKSGFALFSSRVIGILNQIVIKIKPAGPIATVQDLQPAKM